MAALEPAPSAAAGTEPLFDLATVRAEAADAPVRDAAADVVLLLGVVSLVPDPIAALAEARRVDRRLGLIDYCSTGDAAVRAGGSTFPTPDQLAEWLRRGGFTVDAATDVDLAAPAPWQRAVDEYAPDTESSDEVEVRQVIEAGEVAPRMVVAS